MTFKGSTPARRLAQAMLAEVKPLGMEPDDQRVSSVLAGNPNGLLME